MVKVNSDLKSFFETGDQPSQTEFGHLIDSMLPTPVVLNPSSEVLTRDAHQGRTLILPNVTTDTTYTLPTPTAAGERYHFIYGPANGLAEASEFIIQFPASPTLVLWGGLTFIDTDAGDTQFVAFADAVNDRILTINNVGAIDLNFLSYSTTEVYVWGQITSDIIPTFS